MLSSISNCSVFVTGFPRIYATGLFLCPMKTENFRCRKRPVTWNGSTRISRNAFLSKKKLSEWNFHGCGNLFILQRQKCLTSLVEKITLTSIYIWITLKEAWDEQIIYLLLLSWVIVSEGSSCSELTREVIPSGKISVQSPALKTTAFTVGFEQLFVHSLERR